MFITQGKGGDRQAGGDSPGRGGRRRGNGGNGGPDPGNPPPDQGYAPTIGNHVPTWVGVTHIDGGSVYHLTECHNSNREGNRPLTYIPICTACIMDPPTATVTVAVVQYTRTDMEPSVLV